MGKGNRLRAQRAAAPGAVPTTVSVIYPRASNGKVEPVTDIVPREQAIGRLDGSGYDTMLRDDPNLVVVALLSPESIKAWMQPDDYKALVRVMAENERDSK
jgi:hypothetical protein